MPMLTTLRIGFPVKPVQTPLRTRVGEVGHAVEHRVDAGHDVLAVHQDARPPGRAQGHVEHRALLGHVDLLAREHGVDARPQAGRLGQREQEPQGLVGDAVLRVVEVEGDRLEREPLAPLRVLREERPQMNVAHLPVVLRSAAQAAGIMREALRARPRPPRASPWCPPNSKRSAESSLAANSPLPRELNRSKSGRAQHRHRHALVDGGRDGPAALARVGDAAREAVEIPALGERARGEIEQPRGDHAAAPPDLGDVAQIQVVAVVLRVPERRGLRVRARAPRALPALAWRRMLSPSA